MKEKEKLLIIIKNRGNCMKIMCKTCPLHGSAGCLAVLRGRYSEESIYNQAVNLYIEKQYPKGDIAEILL